MSKTELVSLVLASNSTRARSYLCSRACLFIFQWSAFFCLMFFLFRIFVSCFFVTCFFPHSPLHLDGFFTGSILDFKFKPNVSFPQFGHVPYCSISPFSDNDLFYLSIWENNPARNPHTGMLFTSEVFMQPPGARTCICVDGSAFFPPKAKVTPTALWKGEGGCCCKVPVRNHFLHIFFLPSAEGSQGSVST